MEGLIAVEGLALAFTRDGRTTRVLENFDLTVRRGEILSVVGASGVGKSTLLRVVAGLAEPTAGSVRIGEGKRPGETARTALVFQDSRMLPWRRAVGNAAFGLERFPMARKERLARAQAMLELVGLGALGRRWPHELSGGQRQRVALARALAVEPDVLLMDEPFSALDAITREGLQDELLRLRERTGVTVIFVTHDIDEAVHLGDRVIALGGSPGRIVEERTIERPNGRRRGDAAEAALVRSIREDLAAYSAEL